MSLKKTLSIGTQQSQNSDQNTMPTDKRASKARLAKVLACHPGAELYGADRMFATSASGLANHEFDVQVITANSGPLVAALRESGQEPIVMAGVSVLRKSELNPARLIRLLLVGAPSSLIRCLLQVRAVRPDIVYVNTITQPWWILAGRIMRKRVVIHVREAEPDAPSLVRFALVLPTRLAQVVLCNSNHTREFVISSGGPRSRSRVIYNGKPWKTANPTRAAQMRTGTSPEDAFRFIIVGRLSPRKGTDIALDAMALLLKRGFHVQLTLVGDCYIGYEWYLSELRAKADHPNLAGRIRFAGFLDNPVDEVLDCDAAIVPSRMEPFGTTAIESMALGVPTIVSDADGLKEIMCSNDYGYCFSNGDANSLATVCEDVIRNPGRAYMRAIAGQQYVLDKFSESNYITMLAKNILP